MKTIAFQALKGFMTFQGLGFREEHANFYQQFILLKSFLVMLMV